MAMLLQKLRSRGKKDPAATQKVRLSKSSTPKLREFVDSRDYQGAISFLLFNRVEGPHDPNNELWLGYSYFQSGEFEQAKNVYESMLSRNEFTDDVFVYLGCCLFFMGMNEESKDALSKGAPSSLQTRALCHLAFKTGDSGELAKKHSALSADSIEDSMCLASLNFLGQHYDEAVATYANVLEFNENMVAIYFYLSLAQYKQENYDTAEETIKMYLHHHPNSPAGINLHNCIKFRSGKPVNIDPSMIYHLYPSAKLLFQHNYVIFSGGTNALQVLPALVDVVPEARLNITIYHLNREDYESAYKTIDELEPSTPYGYLLKGIVYLLIGQSTFNSQYMITAREYFHEVGMDKNITNTLNGRLAMSAYLFLAGQWEDCIFYLLSVKECFELDERYNFNYGQALVMNERYKEAIEVLALIHTFKSPLHTQFLIRAYVRAGEAQQAWDLFMKVRDGNECTTLLKIIAGDSHKTGQYISMVRAYDALEKMDPSPDHWLGKRAAVSGQFILLVRGKCTGKEMGQALKYLQNGNHSQIEFISRTISTWCTNHAIELS